MELKEAFKGLILSQNTSGVISFLSCLAGKTQGKMSGPYLGDSAVLAFLFILAFSVPSFTTYL